MDTSLLAQELAPLNAQIEKTRARLAGLKGELGEVEAELETFSVDRQRFEALRNVCAALAALEQLEAGELFWGGLTAAGDPAKHLARMQGRIADFEGGIRGITGKQTSLKTQIDQGLDELDYLYEEVRDAHAREERRQEEFVVEREISPVPYRSMLMPWTTQGESERYFRRALLIALLLSIGLGYLVPLVHVPIPDRSAMVIEIPERLAMLVKKDPPKPEPVPERRKEEKAPEPDPDKPKKPEKEPERPVKEQQKPAPGETQLARKKAENVGVLAFKNTFSDLLEDTPVPKLGTEARLSKDSPQASGQARASRSLVAMQATGGASGGIANAGVSRNIGSGSGGGGGSGGRLGGVGFARVESAVAGLAEESRPLSAGPGPARTDEEIQIVFDRYKAALYRIYNTELRKNPTLRGKILMRITIEPGGEVSACAVESTDLASAELVAQIIDRVKRFNFGPKDDVPKTTILYPIDFLPAG